MSAVFVSYRRDDTGMVARDVVKELEASLDATVFFDLESVKAGQAFRELIAESLQRCSVVIVLLGKDWYGRSGVGAGARRIDDEDDIFRQEIELALRTSALIIPVLVGDAFTISATELPASLRSLASLQWHRIQLKDKDEAIAKLREVVQEALYNMESARLSGSADALSGMKPYRKLLSLQFGVPHSGAARRADSVPLSSSHAEELVFRMNAALVTGRPLLVIGSASSGREEIARVAAEQLGARYLEHHLSRRSNPRDLLYTFDESRRSADAQVSRQLHRSNEYVEPGIWWWAFDPDSAARRGMDSGELESTAVTRALDPSPTWAGATSQAAYTVVLLSGIDRIPLAELEEHLYPFSTREFTISVAHYTVRAAGRILLVLTAEGVRSLNRELRRRLVIYRMPLPSIDEFVRVGRTYFPDLAPKFIEDVAQKLLDARAEVGARWLVELPEFLDVVRAASELDVEVGGLNWRLLLDSLGLTG